MIFAIEEINSDSDILPGVTLGYKIYNNCGTMDILRAAMALVSGQEAVVGDSSCRDTVPAILGHSGSTPTIGFARLVGRFQIPVVRITEILHPRRMAVLLRLCYVNTGA